jgi:hypothetical protein
MVLSPLSKILIFSRAIAWKRPIIGRSLLAAKGNRRRGETVDSRILCHLFLVTSVFERVTIRTLHECNTDLELEMKRVRVGFDERGHFRAFEQCDTSFVRAVSPV